MAITKTRFGTYLVLVYVPEGGQLKRIRKTFKRKKDADKFEQDTKTDIRRGDFSPMINKTIRYGADLLLTREKARTKIQSYLHRKNHVDKYIIPAFGDVAMTALSWEEIEKKAGGWKIAPQTVKKIYATLNRIYTVIGKKFGLRYNPMMMVDPPGENLTLEEITKTPSGDLVESEVGFKQRGLRAIDPNEVYTVDEIPKLLVASALPKFPPVVKVRHLLGLYTGLRHGELNGLRWEFVDLDAGEIYVRKSLTELKGVFVLETVKTPAGIRTIKLGAHVISELKRWKLQCPPNEMGLVLPSELGKPAHRSTNDDRLHRAAKEAGIPILSINNLRHTYATQSLLSGVTPLELARLMGHRNQFTTLTIYAKWCDREVSNAAILLEARLTPKG